MTLRTATSRCRRGALAATVGLALALPISGPVMADPSITLFEWAANLDGAIYNLGDGAPGVSVSAFDDGTGLGTITLTIAGDGAHSVLGFFDHEIDEATNTFFNEFGSTSGTAAAGQSWEIDEPGYRVPNPGDIYDNFVAGTLDTSNGVPSTAPDDVSMAMGWVFVLDPTSGPQALVTFTVGTVAPTSGFYLTQTDPDSGKSIFLSSTLRFGSFDQPMPEPGTLALLGLGLGVLAGLRRSKGIA